jgi:hypothetical protein
MAATADRICDLRQAAPAAVADRTRDPRQAAPATAADRIWDLRQAASAPSSTCAKQHLRQAAPAAVAAAFSTNEQSHTPPQNSALCFMPRRQIAFVLTCGMAQHRNSAYSTNPWRYLLHTHY